MAALERHDSIEHHRSGPGGAERESGNIIGIILISMICGTTAAITALLFGASLWTMLLLYSLVGSASGLLVPAVQMIRSSAKRKDASGLVLRRPEGY
ncbi:hypothetical protein PVV74_04125 [Roseovarius sp. SK2]|uniref:hypothetical protein n=1 Tax=Roseovarius TaxID=74030 RepID=UPI00237A5901|nr:hypothetical protein [Roseovarius sp. SK2]MDD9724635.1 hypothetical protein [Roseovarius sp. SK2]